MLARKALPYFTGLLVLLTIAYSPVPGRGLSQDSGLGPSANSLKRGGVIKGRVVGADTGAGLAKAVIR